MSPKTGATVIMIIDWVLLAIAAVLVILFAAVFGVAFNSIAEEVSKQSGGKYNGAEVAATGGIVIVVVGGLNVLINLILNVVLTYGINKESHGHCKAWVIVQLIFWGIQLLGIVIGLAMARGNLTLLGGIPFLFYRALSIYLVKNYYTSLRRVNSGAGSGRGQKY